MRMYSLRQVRRIRQIIADVSAFLGIVVAFVYAHRVRAGILEYAPVAEEIVSSGEEAQTFVNGIAEQMRQIPIVGPSIAEAFESSVGLPDQIVSTGEALSSAIEQFGDLAWAVVLLGPLIAILIAWVPWRSRFVVRSLEVAKLRATEAGIDILALRAIAAGPVTEVLRTHPRPARVSLEDPRVRDALASIQLREYGHTLAARVQ